MKPSNLTRAIIDATVDRGLREISEDPKRSIRKLTDMGRRYSSGRFLDEIYAIMQDLLRNDDSPYYTAIEHLLRNTKRKHIKHFGINLGYHSLSFGGKVIRKLEETRPYTIPWCLILHLGSDTESDASALTRLVTEGAELGIYSFILRCDGSADRLGAVLDVIAEQRDAAFITLMPEGPLDAELIDQINTCTNTLFIFDAQDPCAVENTDLMRKNKLLYGMYDTYSDENAEEWISGRRAQEFLPFDTSFVFLAPSDACSERTKDRMYAFVKQHRMRPKLPFIIFDLFGDFMEINRIVSDHVGYFEQMKNGDIRTAHEIVPDVSQDLSLEDLLSLSLSRGQS